MAFPSIFNQRIFLNQEKVESVTLSMVHLNSGDADFENLSLFWKLKSLTITGNANFQEAAQNILKILAMQIGTLEGKIVVNLKEIIVIPLEKK